VKTVNKKLIAGIIIVSVVIGLFLFFPKGNGKEYIDETITLQIGKGYTVKSGLHTWWLFYSGFLPIENVYVFTVLYVGVNEGTSYEIYVLGSTVKHREFYVLDKHFRIESTKWKEVTLRVTS